MRVERLDVRARVVRALLDFARGSSSTATMKIARGDNVWEIHINMGVDDCNIDEEAVIAEVGGRDIWERSGGDEVI